MKWERPASEAWCVPGAAGAGGLDARHAAPGAAGGSAGARASELVTPLRAHGMHAAYLQNPAASDYTFRFGHATQRPQWLLVPRPIPNSQLHRVAPNQSILATSRTRHSL